MALRTRVLGWFYGQANLSALTNVCARVAFTLCALASGAPPSDAQQQAFTRALGGGAVAAPARAFIAACLQKGRRVRLGSGGSAEVRGAPFFTLEGGALGLEGGGESPLEPMNWDALLARKLPPPWLPALKDEADASLFPDMANFSEPTHPPVDAKTQELFADFLLATRVVS